MAALLLAGCFFLIGGGWLQKRYDLRRLAQERYEAAFVGLYDISAYREEDFIQYGGIPTVKGSYILRDWKDLREYLDKIFSSGNPVTHVYVAMEPKILWEKSGKTEEKWAESMRSYLAPYIEERQNVTFEFLLPTPSLAYWVKMDAVSFQENLTAYGRFARDMSAYGNAVVYFMGGAQWLIANPANYSTLFLTSPELSHKKLLYTFCDHEFWLDASNADTVLEALRSMVAQEKETPTVYPDLSDWCMIFLGDSVLEYNAGTGSIPDVVGGLSGAQTYNCAQGGISASGQESANLTFHQMVRRFIQQDLSGLDPASNFCRSVTKYTQESHKGKRYCFVINYGLNDYFGAHPVENESNPYDEESYAGALRSGIRTLQKEYPEAQILVLTPNYVSYFSEGRDVLGEKGGALTDYVDAAIRAAQDRNVRWIDNYGDSGINADTHGIYLADGCHPNETGAFLLGRRILEEMEHVAAPDK